MTQTLMEFLSIVHPSGRSGPERQDVAELRSYCAPLELAGRRFARRLARLNETVADMAPGGWLIGAPLCPSACVPGPLADFVLSLGTDPFRGWNMVLYADCAKTARILNTVPYHPDYATAIDEVMVDYLGGLRRSRDVQRATRSAMPSASVSALNKTYRDRLFADCARIEKTLFGARQRQWRLQSESAGAETSPPNATISAAMSAGNGAENRISLPLTG